MHEVNIAHIMEGDCFISIFFPKRSVLSCAYNEENSNNTEMTNIVKYTSLPDRNAHVLH